MKILVTGAAGFLGTRVIRALLDGTRDDPTPSAIVAADLAACPIDDPRIDARVGTMADPRFVRSIVEPDVTRVYHLAAMLSGQSEAEFDAGLRINVDATRDLLEACRALGTAPRVVFTSTVAVFGPPLPAVVPEDLVPRPQSSYGAAKVVGEVLVAEYSRRGFIDGLSVRVPTVAVRPGRPNSALSSFVSGIIREPLAGEHATCPVPLDTPLWIASPGVVVQNLVYAGRVPAAALEGRRTLNLPGLSVTPADMLDALQRVAGPEARARVRHELDRACARVVCSWPGALDISRALRLGFTAERDIDEIVRAAARPHR